MCRALPSTLSLGHLLFKKMFEKGMFVVYHGYMKDIVFEYDPQKSVLNQHKHGVDFEKAKNLWFVENIIIPLMTAPEARYMIIGKIENKLFSCIFTYRGTKVRIISCRRVRLQKEAELYYEYYQ